MKIFVSGGQGFIGKKLISSLCLQGLKVNMLSRHSVISDNPNINVIKGDLTSDDCPFDQLIKDCNLIFNCAGEVNDSSKMKLLHVDGTKKLLHAVKMESKRTGRTIHWVQLSSVGAYGPSLRGANIDRVISENSPIHPSNEYEITKTVADNLVIEASKKGWLTYSIVRPSNVIGKNMPNQSLYQMGGVIKKGLFFFIGKEGAIATYIHVDDVIQVLLLCGFNPKAKNEIYNISNDCLFEEIVNSIALALNVKCPKIRLPEKFIRAIIWLISKVTNIPLTQDRINALISRTRYPYTKLEQKLEYTPKISIPNIISEVISIN